MGPPPDGHSSPAPTAGRRLPPSEADAAPLQAWVRPYEDAVYRPRDAAPLPRPRATPPANLRPAHGARPAGCLSYVCQE